MVRCNLSEMEDKILDWVVIDQTAPAKALAEPTIRRYLDPFIGRELTVTQAARELGVSGNSLLYRVRQFVRLGLLTVVRETPRVGKAVKTYRASSDLFFVPFALTPAATLEAMVWPLESAWQHRFTAAGAQVISRDGAKLGLRIWRGETSEIYTKPAPPPPETFGESLLERFPVLSIWSDQLHLDPDDAVALQRELLELFRRYAERSGKNRHIVHLGLSPLFDA